MTKYIGAHVSIAGGAENAPLRAAKLGGRAFAMFTANQRQWKSRPLTQATIDAFASNLKISRIRPEHVLVHDGYLINLGNHDPEKWQRSANAFVDEARRVEQLGLALLNFHPGSHLNKVSVDRCMDLISDGIRQAMAATDKVIFVLESTAGQGSNLGSSFEELAAIIDRVGMRERMGVCLDTCHLYAAGYDLVDDYDGVMREFDRVIGFELLKGVHLNDSKSSLGRHLDRHHSLGQGTLGWPVFARIMTDSRFDNIPMVLETINSDLWRKEIATLYGYK